jgi:predicted outer membrane lipoprotein
VHAQNRFPHPFSRHGEQLSPFGDRVVSKKRQHFAFGINDFLLLELIEDVARFIQTETPMFLVPLGLLLAQAQPLIDGLARLMH